MKGLFAIFFAFMAMPVGAWSQLAAERAWSHLRATQPLAFRYDEARDHLAYVRWNTPLSIAAPDRLAKAESFLTTYGAAYGLDPQTATWQLAREQRDLAGNYHLRLEHRHENIPVFSGMLDFHFDREERLTGVDGTVLTEFAGTADPDLTSAQATELALSWAGKHYPHVPASRLRLSVPELQWFQKGLVQGVAGSVQLVYYIEVADRHHLRDYLIIDAHDGRVVEHFAGICDLAERELYSETTDQLVWSDGDAFPAELSDWQQQQLASTEDVYYLFKNTFGYLSYDNLDGTLRMVDEATFLNCPNASWNGYTTNYCPAISTNDVVAHEWGHAYTEYTSDLLYAWQAGAINEAYSDIWGETLDLLNSPTENPLREGCNSGDRWLIAEEATSLGGAIRDLWNPNCYGKPGKVSDEQYVCTAADHGGVHSNSGVVAHAYALLVDGGEYNGYMITGIGLDKTAHLFWQAQAYYLGRTSDFRVLADALTAAYLDLRGAELPVLDISEAGENTATVSLGTADSLALQNALLATELRLIPDCPNFSTLLDPNTPNLCLEDDLVFTPFYTEDFEDGTYEWLISAQPGDPASWISRQWTLTDQLPDERSGQGMFAASPNVGHCDTLPNHGILGLRSPNITIPAALEGPVYLTFDHYFSLADGDGGNVKIQQNGGTWRTIPRPAFTFNEYNDLLLLPPLTDNPLAGQRIFSGSNTGSVTGSWGTSQIDLSVIGVEPGETIRLRWELGTDGCGGWSGWYVDDIQLGTCAASILPVNWLRFTARARGRTVLLDWATSAEENNKGFYVERSPDGKKFEEVGFVAAGATSGAEYTFQDASFPAFTTDLYYRLRQTDRDGHFSYSSLRHVVLEAVNDWGVYPNPATDRCTVYWREAPFDHATVSIADMNGCQLMMVPFTDASVPLTMNLDLLPTGIYTLQIVTEDHSYAQKLVID